MAGPQGGIYQPVSALTQELNTDTPTPLMTESKNHTLKSRISRWWDSNSSLRGSCHLPRCPTGGYFKDTCPFLPGPTSCDNSSCSLLIFTPRWGALEFPLEFHHEPQAISG